MLINCLLTKSKTKHQENLAVMVKIKKNKKTKTPALKTKDIGIFNHYNIVKGKIKVYCCKTKGGKQNIYKEELKEGEK